MRIRFPCRRKLLRASMWFKIAAVIALTFLMAGLLPHSCNLTDYVRAENIPDDLVTISNDRLSLLPNCPLNKSEGELPPVPQRSRTITVDNLTFLTSKFDIAPSGHGRPTGVCQPQVKVAIVVPYRDRPTQLHAFLWYMHQFLSLQQVDYTIIIVEQSYTLPFNRAKLFNVGFKESLTLDDHDCFIFHDVDLLPENLLNIYGCSRQPRHLITALNTFRYNLLHCNQFSGAVALTKEHFEKVNGFSNRFYGWGGEDDEFYDRVTGVNFSITRWDPAVARYTRIIHKKETPNPDHLATLESLDKETQHKDGLLSLTYKLLEYELMPLYTWIYVDL